ncbi:DUF1302 family protein [Azonexus sp.]|uniref:DUF1302 family protein n=1 Tax=Azonexus sp. TaxID=1872668 RepID=UPI0035B3E897
METLSNGAWQRSLLAIAVGCAFAAPAAAEELPAMGEESSPWQVDVTYENHTVRREHVGLAKFRNTLQAELDKEVGDGWKVHGIVRGSWDGVYRMNSDEYGNKAGGSISMQSTTPGGYLTTPWGTGPVTYSLVNGVFGLAGNKFVDAYPASNPNAGLRVLGDRWHKIDGGVAFAVPVRPCDVDKRGCRDFGGYGDLKRSELEAPEFNDRLDFLRELYAKKDFDLGDGKSLFVKLGRQQVVWGRTDLFRVLDVINPVDFSRNNIYDELSDIRIPMWIAQVEYRMGASDTMQDRNLQFVWNVDKFRPNNLGQCGSPNTILDAGCFFRGMANLWDNGGTVSNFANVAPGTLLATNFGPGQIGLDKVHLPSWSLSNTQFGMKYEGVTQDGLSFSLNALTYRSQLPSLRGGKRATNSFTGVYQDAWPYLISFDMHFPRVNLIGGSMDFQVPAAGAAVRVEAAYTDGEEFANTNRPELYSKNNVFRSVIGIDRPTFIPFISETQATLFSGQLFYQHIFDHEWKRGALGPVGMPDWEDNVIGTLLIKAFLKNGMVSPQVIFAHDFKARATVVAPQVEMHLSNDLKVTIGANYKLAEGRSRWEFDDCRACNPFAPFTAPNGDTDPFTSYSRGLAGMEPAGRFRAGPIGAAFKENDLFIKLNYKF